MDVKQMREQGYIALSRLLQRPDKELQELISSSEFSELWQQIEDSFGVRLPASWNARELPGLQELDRMWNITMGPINALAEPIESLYKVWTTDTSCEMTFANQKGYLKSDWACHMQELLTGAGFEIPQQFVHCPDHLILELEFASILVEDAPAETQIKFAENHFDWLEDLCQTAKNKDVPKVYQDLYCLCLQYVMADLKSIKA